MDTMEESTEDLPPLENVEASVGPGSQDVVQIHAGNDDLDKASPHVKVHETYT